MSKLPDCMMPDGADPCAGFKEIYNENATLRADLARVTAQRDAYRRAVEAWKAHDDLRGHPGDPDYQSDSLMLLDEARRLTAEAEKEGAQ